MLSCTILSLLGLPRLLEDLLESTYPAPAGYKALMCPVGAFHVNFQPFYFIDNYTMIFAITVYQHHRNLMHRLWFILKEALYLEHNCVKLYKNKDGLPQN